MPILGRTRKWKPYPHLGDALLALPFLLDTFGNLFGLYDNFVRTDDVLHFINWVLLVMAYQAFRYRNVHTNRDAIILGYGFGAIAIILWEAMEWAVSEDGWGGAGGLQLTYSDTVGDLVISSTGGLIGAVAALAWFGAKKGLATEQ